MYPGNSMQAKEVNDAWTATFLAGLDLECLWLSEKTCHWKTLLASHQKETMYFLSTVGLSLDDIAVKVKRNSF